MSAATIRDVAKLAKVSTATVSRVFNDSASVSEPTRQKVLDAGSQLDYSPNPSARRLSLGRTHTIAVVLPFLTLPSFVERLRGVQHALAKSEYDLVLFTAGNPEQIEKYIKQLSRKGRVDGLVLISTPLNEKQAQRIVESGVPTVLIDTSHPQINHVIIDDVAGGQRATSHLTQLGHRKIAFLSDHLENPFNFIPMRQRFEGYRQAINQAGIEFRPAYHGQCSLGGGDAYQKARNLITLPDPPTAIFAASDTHAVAVLQAAKDLGIEVPKQLSVIGFDDIRDATYLDLTTVQQPLFESGVVGVNTLLNTFTTHSVSTHKEILPTQLIIRATTTTQPG